MVHWYPTDDTQVSKQFTRKAGRLNPNDRTDHSGGALVETAWLPSNCTVENSRTSPLPMPCVSSRQLGKQDDN
jgi:hypothetical protein